MELTRLNGFVMVRPLIQITTGTVAINRNTELAGIVGDLPPSTVLSDGRKRILSSKRLAPLFNCRRAVERLLEREGAAFLGASLVPQDRLQSVEDGLVEIEQRFNQELDDLANNLPEAYVEWESAYPEWASLISTNRLTPTALKDRCRFAVAYFKPAPPDEDVGNRFSASLNEAIPAVMEDAARESERLLAEFCIGKESVTQKVVNAVQRLLEKLQSFSMLDPRVSPSVTGFRSVLEGLPSTGRIAGRDFSVLNAMLRQIADPQRLLEHGERLFANAKAGTSLFDALDMKQEDAAVDETIDETVIVEVDAAEKVAPVWAALI